MSLATRCTACDTVFRVVQDQLKVSEGWVRCGRCQAVFNALDNLFDLEPEPPQAQAAVGPADTPAVATPEATLLAPADAPPWPYAPAQTVDGAVPNVTHATPRFEDPEPPAVSRPVDFDETPASRVAARDRNDFADAQFNSALLAEAGIEGADSTPDTASSTAAETAPEFLRPARQDRPRTVAALWLLCAVLLLALGLQAAVHFRSLLAVTTPAVRPALEAMCDWLACRVEPLRRIDDIVIESSTLASAPGGDAVRLSLVLRNRGPLPLAMPSVELTLTDAGGQMLARRALSPADFGVTSTTLPAASEQPLQLVMSTGSRRASGYTVEPFYP